MRTSSKFRILQVIGAAGLLLTARCAFGGQVGSWMEKNDPSGFSVKIPAGWGAEGAKDGHVLIHSADRSVFAVLQPFKLSGGKASDTIGPLIQHMKTLFPEAHLTQQRTVSAQPDEAVAKVSFRSNGKAGTANALCFVNGGAGMLYVIAAPESQFAASKVTLIQVLTSFQYTAATARNAGPASASGGPITYTAWTEPNEKAFTVQIPRGWHVVGGEYRCSAIDLRAQYSVVSPDGQIRAQYGDAKMLPFTQNRIIKMKEGSIYHTYGGLHMILNYEKGEQFSRGYTNLVLKKEHPDLQITGTKDRPDIQQFLEKLFAKSPVKTEISSGETDYTFTQNGKTMQGACIATTILSAPGTAGEGWTAVPAFCSAPADKMPIAFEVLGHMALPKFSPAWLQKVNQDAAAFTVAMQRDFHRTMAQSQAQYEKFSHDLAESNRQLDNILTNSADVADSSGHAYHVEGGHNYYYGNAGTVVGTNSPTPPDINFTPLKQF